MIEQKSRRALSKTTSIEHINIYEAKQIAINLKFLYIVFINGLDFKVFLSIPVIKLWYEFSLSTADMLSCEKMFLINVSSYFSNLSSVNPPGIAMS